MKLQMEKLELLSATELTEINGGDGGLVKNVIDFLSKNWDSFGQACEDAGRGLGCWLRSIF
jgi:hypothetical protein